MTEKSYAPSKQEKMNIKENIAVHPHAHEEQKLEAEIEKVQENKTGSTKVENNPEQVKEEKKEDKKKPEIKKKESAEVNAKDMGISLKHSMAICDMIRGKKPEIGIWKLEMALKKKFAIPMKGEIPHRHGNIMAGRYCFKASEAFIKLLKQLIANANVNGLDSSKINISEARASQASQPFRRFGKGRMKRAHIYLKVRETVK